LKKPVAARENKASGKTAKKPPQESIRSTPISRMAALGGTGAKVGINYLKYYGKRALSGGSNSSLETHARELDEENASTIYDTFSKLKGGPLKLAQMLSIDKNLLPPAYANQFVQAQYSVPPLSYPLVVRTFLREFNKEPLEIFESFGREAAHGASIGQVHKASMEGVDYAVKVQYPGVAESLKSDLRVVKPIALRILGLRQRDVEKYFQEVETRLLEETDYGLELERSLHLSEASAHLPNLRFPTYHPELSSRHILTMEWIDGMPLDRFADGDATQAARDLIGQALWDFYSHQVHDLNLFHADPHPGNFLVSDKKLCVLDFGCTKQITHEFYRKQFRFLDPNLTKDPALLEEALRDLEVIIESDTGKEITQIMMLCSSWLDLLALPFRSDRFDFGDPVFLQSIYDLGEENRKADNLRTMKGERGSPDTIYVNRAFFGLYSLLGRLRAKVNVSLPDWLKE
jgi:predicted unusual protein kinase regulating ubiquinone biosynthesis (AarF/ABC1/UbiB family)